VERRVGNSDLDHDRHRGAAPARDERDDAIGADRTTDSDAT
jgi:hypothetical protein